MMGARNLFCSLVFFANVATAASTNICVDPAARAHLTSVKNQVPLAEFLKLATRSRLILFGEIHFTSPGLRARLLKEFAAVFGVNALGVNALGVNALGGKACLFYELDHTRTLAETLREFSQPGFERNLAEFSEMHEAARQAGLRELPVDRPFSWDQLEDGATNARNIFMTKKIVNALRDCEKAVMFVGKAHAFTDAPKQPTLQARLRARGIDVLAVNLQETREGADITAPLASWNNVCPRGASLPAVDAPVAVPLAALSRALRFHPNTQSPARWRDFDWALLVP